MTHTYNIGGVTCQNCVNAVTSALLAIAGVTKIDIDLKGKKASITMDKHIETATLQNALPKKYKLHDSVKQVTDGSKSWLETYKPILLVFAFITGITLLIQYTSGTFNYMVWMRHFMAAFFLTFAFFKLMDLKGFATSYTTYDIVAKKIPVWALIYPFAELVLGINYLLNLLPLATNIVAFIIMSVSIIGVLQAVLNKQKIKCACLGAVFNLPMSTVTIIEDALMILMSGFMILQLT